MQRRGFTNSSTGHVVPFVLDWKLVRLHPKIGGLNASCCAILTLYKQIVSVEHVSKIAPSFNKLSCELHVFTNARSVRSE